MSAAIRIVRRLLGYGTLGVVLTLLASYGFYLSSLPALSVWHTARLDAEYTAGDAERVRTIADYRANEDRLFAQLQAEVYDQIPASERRALNRYAVGSQADPRQVQPDWNRTQELPVAAPKGAVLLLHGLSDGPYSMRALGQHLQAQGFHVVLLRLPGHGAAPSGLLYADWHDMAAAVRMAMRDLNTRLGADVPITMVGYSTGAALAVDYALARLQGEALPAVARLVLLSPAIGVSPAARFAVWQGRLAVLARAPKAAWTDLQPEYDPYKFNSFTINAADLVYQITVDIRARLDALGKGGPISGLPPILAFSSVADATVSTQAVVSTLFERLAPQGHRLVLYDVNRHAEVAALFTPEALAVNRTLVDGPPLPFELAIVGNADSRSVAIVTRTRKAGSRDLGESPPGMQWPTHVYSMSHVALPFPPADPVYGMAPVEGAPLVFLGRLDVQGERSLLAVPPATMLRLRHNPFFDSMAADIDSFVARR